MHFKKTMIIQFSIMLSKRQKVRPRSEPDLGRMQKGKEVTTTVKRADFKKLQKLKLSLSLVIMHMKLVGIAPNH